MLFKIIYFLKGFYDTHSYWIKSNYILHSRGK